MDIEVQTELVAGLPAKVVRGNEYDRIQIDGKTIAYVVPSKRAGGVKLDFPTPKTIPAKFKTKAMTVRGNRATFLVDGKNVTKGRELLEWLVT